MGTDEGFLCFEWKQNMIQFAAPIGLSLLKLLPKYPGTASALRMLEASELWSVHWWDGVATNDQTRPRQMERTEGKQLLCDFSVTNYKLVQAEMKVFVKNLRGPSILH